MCKYQWLTALITNYLLDNFVLFEVATHVGKVSYQLKLSETSKVHPVLHVSLLRGALPPDTTVAPDLAEPPLPHTAPSISKKVLAKCFFI